MEIASKSYLSLYEHLLVHKLRDDAAYVPSLTYVAEVYGHVVGLIMYAKAQLILKDGSAAEILTFGPLCVDPQYQNKGIGGKLLTETLFEAKNLGAKGIVIFGEPDYYPKFGFSTCDKWGITTAEGKNFSSFLGIELVPGGLDYPGAYFKEPEVYYNLPKDELEIFDKLFPYMEKKRLPGQWPD